MNLRLKAVTYVIFSQCKEWLYCSRSCAIYRYQCDMQKRTMSTAVRQDPVLWDMALIINLISNNKGSCPDAVIRRITASQWKNSFQTIVEFSEGECFVTAPYRFWCRSYVPSNTFPRVILLLSHGEQNILKIMHSILVLTYHIRLCGTATHTLPQSQWRGQRRWANGPCQSSLSCKASEHRHI